MPHPAILEDLGYAGTMELANRWWVLALRGLAAIAFGVLTFVAPKLTLLVLITLFGAYALVDGVFNLVLAVRRGRAGFSWGWFVFEGLASVAAGVVTFLWPGITALWLLFIIAAWAVVTGVAEIASAIRLRKQIRDEWLLALSGVFSVALGVLLFLYPGAGALAMVVWIGIYALIFGGLTLTLAFRLRAWRRSDERPLPSGGLPMAR
jgi:uncharacterized membrane protein HdeD (DUF308 family)